MSSHLPNESAISALCELCGLELKQVVAGLPNEKMHRLTRERLVNRSGKVKEETLEELAKFFNARLSLSIKGMDLVNPPPVLQAIIRGLHPETSAAAVTVHANQGDALRALVARLKQHKEYLQSKTASVVTFTLDTLEHEVKAIFLVELGVQCLELFLGRVRTARALSSSRQEELIIKHMLHIDQELGEEQGRGTEDWAARVRERPELREPLRRSTIKEFRYSCAHTFQGWLIPDSAVCVAPFGWFPTLLDYPQTAEAQNIVERYRTYSITCGHHTNEYTLNGWMMPHFQAFFQPGTDNTSFRALEKFVQLYTDAHRVAESAVPAPQ